MKNRVILITLASLMALTGCKQNPVEDKSASFDWDNNDKLEYTIDYTVHFTADHDSTIQVAATGNYGTGGGLSYGGGEGESGFMHVQIVGSDDMVEIRIPGTDDYTLYSIRDNMFYEPYDEQSITIGEGQRFSITLPVMTELKYPKDKESHTVRIGFDIE